MRPELRPMNISKEVVLYWQTWGWIFDDCLWSEGYHRATVCTRQGVNKIIMWANIVLIYRPLLLAANVNVTLHWIRRLSTAPAADLVCEGRVRMVVIITLITLAALSPTIGGYYPELNMLNIVLLRFHPPLSSQLSSPLSQHTEYVSH